jgi:hypothetical protein
MSLEILFRNRGLAVNGNDTRVTKEGSDTVRKEITYRTTATRSFLTKLPASKTMQYTPLRRRPRSMRRV